MMENSDDQFACPIDQSKILIRGKRTKRQRTSPLYGSGGIISIASSSSIYSSSSITSTNTYDVYDSIDQEDEDMANCLILLAQGDREKIEEYSHGGSDDKFIEIVTNFPRKVGNYTYQCKTCNRSFASFQALGGHRASHKKPKMKNLVEDKKNQEMNHGEFKKDEDIFEHLDSPRNEIVMDKIINPSTPSRSQPPQMITNNSVQTDSNKTHECSICGAAFTSGQALGGHMRKHRAVGPHPTGSAAAATQITSSSNFDQSSSTTSSGLPEAVQFQKPRDIFSLDLNLPATEDDPRDIMFQFVTPQQSLVLSSPA